MRLQENEELFDCPNDFCDCKVEKSWEECPKCRTEIVYCAQIPHMVFKSQFESEKPMCKKCWKETEKRA